MRYITCIILALLCLSQANAQNELESEAFYIYRNDGEFNGFFYDEVLEMRYSKLSLDSIEYKDFVVQEVVTEDSIYRIPLCAIDSIGFVQPEVILNPGIHNIDEMGLEPYITPNTNWRSHIYVYKNIPTDLLPKVGDVLMRLGDKENGIDGFGRKVTKVYDDGNDRYDIQLSPLEDLSDVFTQLIGVEKLVTDEEGNTKRKVSQMRKASGSGSANLINLAFTLQKDLPYDDKTKITLAAELGMKLSVGVEYNITYSNFFFKVTDHSALTAKPSITASTEWASFERNWSLLPGLCFYVPASCPVMSIDPLPKLFIKGSLSASIGMTFPESGIGMTETFIFDNGSMSYNRNYNIEGYNAFGSDPFINFFKNMDVNAKLHGEVQAGIKSEIGIGAADWLSDIVDTYIGVDVYVGPKIEGDLEFSMQKLYEGGSYILNNPPKVTLTGLSLDAEAKGTFKFLWNDPNTETFATLSEQFWKEEYYALPKMDSITFKQNVITGTQKLTTKLTRKGYLPVKLGFEIEDGNGEKTILNLPDIDFTTKETDFDFETNFATGGYKLTPFYDLNGTTIKGSVQYFTVRELLTEMKEVHLSVGLAIPESELESIPLDYGTIFAVFLGETKVTPLDDCTAKIEATSYPKWDNQEQTGNVSMIITASEIENGFGTATVENIQWNHSSKYYDEDWDTGAKYPNISSFRGQIPQITTNVTSYYTHYYYGTTPNGSCSKSYNGYRDISGWNEPSVWVSETSSYSYDGKYPLDVRIEFDKERTVK